MAYIESLFYYVLIVGISLVSFYLVIFLISFIYLSIKATIKNKRGASFYENQEIFKKIKQHKSLKSFIYIYSVAFIFFYVFQSFNYYGKDRAYPQAKAYKIVADVSAFFFETFVSSRNLYFKPEGLKYIKPYEQWQNYLINKAFNYIPEDDGERAIWKYEYLYANYTRANTAPIDFEKLDAINLKALINVGGHPTLYKTSVQTMVQDISKMIDLLLDGNIKDKSYKNINFYAIASLYGVWIEDMKFLYYSLGVKNPNEWDVEYSNQIEKWTEDNIYLERIKRLSVLLDEAKEKLNQDKTLKSFFKSHKYLYPEMMGLRVALQAHLVYVDLLYKDFSCNMESVDKYLQYRKEFIKYANTSKVYKSFNWMERHKAKSLVEYHGNTLIMYILNNKCNIKEEDLILKHKIENNWDLTRIESIKTKTILESLPLKESLNER